LIVALTLSEQSREIRTERAGNGGLIEVTDEHALAAGRQTGFPATKEAHSATRESCHPTIKAEIRRA
jgi:hypothetical protein